MERPWRHHPQDMLERLSAHADRKLGLEIDRLRLSDPGFKRALDLSLELDDELAARRDSNT